MITALQVAGGHFLSPATISRVVYELTGIDYGLRIFAIDMGKMAKMGIVRVKIEGEKENSWPVCQLAGPWEVARIKYKRSINHEPAAHHKGRSEQQVSM